MDYSSSQTIQIQNKHNFWTLVDTVIHSLTIGKIKFYNSNLKEHILRVYEFKTIFSTELKC